MNQGNNAKVKRLAGVVMIVTKTSIRPARNTECIQGVSLFEALRILVCDELAHDAEIETCTDTCIVTSRVAGDEKIRVTFSNRIGACTKQEAIQIYACIKASGLSGGIDPLPEAIRIYREQTDARIGLCMALLVPMGITEPADIAASIGMPIDDIAAALALAFECPGTSFREIIAA